MDNLHWQSLLAKPSYYYFVGKFETQKLVKYFIKASTKLTRKKITIISFKIRDFKL